MEEARAPRPSSTVPLFLSVAGSALAAVVASVSELGLGEDWSRITHMLGMPAVGVASALLALMFASRIGLSRGRRLWTLVAAGALCLAFAAAGTAPDAPVTDTAATGLVLLRVCAYILFGAVALSAAYHYRSRVDLAWPVIESFVAMAAVGLLVWLSALRAVMLQPVAHTRLLVLDQSFLVADLVFMVGPTLMLALALMRVPERVETAPWLLYGASISATVIGEIGWFVQSANTAEVGSLSDFFWMIGMVGVAVAAALAWDADRCGRLLA